MSEQPMDRDIPEVEILNLLNYGDEPALVTAAVSHMVSSIPEWKPREGNTEMALLEALAVMLGPLVMSMQLAPREMLEQFMVLYGVRRDPGFPASVTLDVQTTPTAGEKTITAGTRFRIDVDGAGNTVDLLSLDTVIINPNDITGYVRVQAEVIGDDLNAVPPGSVVAAVDTIPFAESIITAGPVTAGAGRESDAAFMARASSILARQTSTLVLAEHFQYAVIGEPDVGRAMVLNNYNPDAVDTTIEAPGHVTVAAADLAGNPLEPYRLDEIESMLAQMSLASLTIHVISPTYTSFNLDITVRKTAAAESTEVIAAVDAALRAELSPMGWDWAKTITSNRLVAIVSKAFGVAEVVSVPATITLNGIAPLPRVSTIVTVVQ